MLIKNILISNFKGISKMEVTPEKMNILKGENGIGKTSFLEAIRFALTGDAPDGSIRNGASSMNVEITLDDGTIFSREKFIDKPSVVKVNGKKTPAKNLEELLEVKTGVNKGSMRITTSADVLCGLTPGQLGDFLMSYVPEEVDFDTIVSKYMSAPTPAECTELGTILPSAPSKFGMDKVKAAYAYFFEERKSIKKQIASYEAKIASYSVAEKPPVPCADIQSDIKEIMKSEGAASANKMARKIYEAAVQAKAVAEKNVESLKERIDRNKATLPNVRQLETTEEELRNENERLLNIRSMVKLIQLDIEKFESTLTNLKSSCCPLSDSLVCTTDKTVIKTELEELIQSNKEGLEYQKTEEKKSLEKIATLNSKLEDYKLNENAYNEKVLLTKQYEQAKKEVPVIPPEPEILEEHDFKEELAELQAMLNAWHEFEQREEDMRKLGMLEVRRQTFDSLCKRLEPKGEVMSGLMSHYLSIFEDVINDIARELKTGLDIKFISEDGIRCTVQTDVSSAHKPFELLSQGEKLLTSFLMLDMLNSLCGTKLLLLDDLNHLDKDNFKALFELLNTTEIQDAYDHIVVCTVDNPDINDVVSGSACHVITI